MSRVLHWLLFLVFSNAVFSMSDQTDTAKPISTIEGKEAVPVLKEPPIYPRAALVKGIEGWVITAFVINPDGTPSEISIVDTSIDGYFEEVSIEATKKFLYEPATWNGIPVTQAKNTNMFTFYIQNERSGPSRPFGKRYENASEALQEGDLDKVIDIIGQLEALESRNFHEVFLLDLIKGNYYRAKQDFPAAYRHYQRSLRVAGYVATEEIQSDVLRLAISLAAYLGDYSSALEYYDELKSIEPDLPADDRASVTANKVSELINGNDPLQTTGKISYPCATCESVVPYWSHTLMRRQFTVDQVQGSIDELKLLCGFHYVTFEFQPDTKWTLNKDWGDCFLQLLGTEGTTFRLVEL